MLIERFGEVYPAAVRSFAEDFEASLLAHLKVPVRHQINLLGRSLLEEHRRTRAIGRSTDEKSTMKLVFATLVRVSERWNTISNS
jgi:hypothetical protein